MEKIKSALANVDKLPVAAVERADDVRSMYKAVLNELKAVVSANPRINGKPLTVGVFSETKQGESRVGMTPDLVRLLTLLGISVIVQKGAGVVGAAKGSRFTDDMFAYAGAELVNTAEEVFKRSNILQHIKELQPREKPLAAGASEKEPIIIFNFNHFAQDATRAAKDIATRATFVSFETVQTAEGRKVILEGPSEKAGVISAYQMAFYLTHFEDWEKAQELEDWKRIEAALAEYDSTNIAPIPDIDLKGKRVVVYGGGVVGYNEALILAKMGAQVTVIERNKNRRDILVERFREGRRRDARIKSDVMILDSEDTMKVEEALQESNGISTTAYVMGQTAQPLISRKQFNKNDKAGGKVYTIVDIDQGGGLEKVYSTNHAQPVYKEGKSLIYAVANIPARVPRQTSNDVSMATARYVALMALLGLERTLSMTPEISRAVEASNGRITSPIIEKEIGSKVPKKMHFNTDPTKMTKLERCLAAARKVADKAASAARSSTSGVPQRSETGAQSAFEVLRDVVTEGEILRRTGHHLSPQDVDYVKLEDEEYTLESSTRHMSSGPILGVEIEPSIEKALSEPYNIYLYFDRNSIAKGKEEDLRVLTDGDNLSTLIRYFTEGFIQKREAEATHIEIKLGSLEIDMYGTDKPKNLRHINVKLAKYKTGFVYELALDETTGKLYLMENGARVSTDKMPDASAEIAGDNNRRSTSGVDIVTSDEDAARIAAVLPIENTVEFINANMEKAGKDVIAGIWHNIFKDDKIFEFVIGAVPIDESGKEVPDVALYSPVSGVKSASNALAVKESINNLSISHAIVSVSDKEKLKDAILKISTEVAKGVPQARIHCAISKTVLEVIDKDEGLLKVLKAASAREFLAKNTMLDVINDRVENSRAVLAMPYGRVTLNGLARLNLANIIEAGDKGEAYRQAVTLLARTIGLLTNNLDKVNDIEDSLLAQSEGDPRGFFIAKTFEIALPRCEPVNMDAIKAGFEREAIILRSL